MDAPALAGHGAPRSLVRTHHFYTAKLPWIRKKTFQPEPDVTSQNLLEPHKGEEATPALSQTPPEGSLLLDHFLGALYAPKDGPR